VPRKTNLLLIENSTGHSGSAISLCNLVANLDRAEFCPFVAFSRREQLEYFRRSFGASTGTAVVRCASLAKDTPVGRRIGKASKAVHPWVARAVYGIFGLLDLVFVYVPYVLRLARLAKGKEIDLIHQNNGVDFGAILLSRLLRKPLLAYQRGAEWDSRFVRFMAKRVDFYIANSGQTWRDLSAIGVPPGKMTVITPPVDLGKYDPAIDCAKQRAEFGITGSDPCFGILGSLMEWKGQRVFIKAARTVLERIPNARAFVIGGLPDGANPGYERELRDLAASLGIGDRVVFTGFRHDMPEMIQMQSTIVHASVTPEPFGRVIIESMAMKKPVIASKAGGPLEIIDDGVNGFLVPPGDDAELARKITLLLTDPGLASALGREAHAKTRRLYTIEPHVEAVSKVYGDVLRRARGEPDDQGSEAGRAPREPA